MKTLGLLRNLVSPRPHTDTMMTLHGTQVMQGVVLVLEGIHSPEVTNLNNFSQRLEHIFLLCNFVWAGYEANISKVFACSPSICYKFSSVKCFNVLHSFRDIRR